MQHCLTKRKKGGRGGKGRERERGKNKGRGRDCRGERGKERKTRIRKEEEGEKEEGEKGEKEEEGEEKKGEKEGDSAPSHRTHHMVLNKQVASGEHKTLSRLPSFKCCLQTAMGHLLPPL